MMPNFMLIKELSFMNLSDIKKPILYMNKLFNLARMSNVTPI